MTKKKHEDHTRLRICWCSFIKKVYDIYGWGGKEDFTDKMHIFREAVLLAPNFTKRRGNKDEKYAVSRSFYLEEAESELRCKKNCLEEWEFDAYVLGAPNYYEKGGEDFNIDAYAKNFYALHPELQKWKKKDEDETVSNL